VKLDAEILCIMGSNVCNDKWAENWPKKELCYGSFLQIGLINCLLKCPTKMT